MSLISDIIDTYLPANMVDGWDQMTSPGSNIIEGATEIGINWILDAVIENKWNFFKEAWTGVMYFANGIAVKANTGTRNQPFGQPQSSGAATAAKVIGNLATIPLTGEVGIEVGITTFFQTKEAKEFQMMSEGILMMPNIGGIPISTQAVDSEREIVISEQQLIVQDGGKKQYWTDNAVPKLRTWNMTGYITPALMSDQMFAIKPSLDMQCKFLDICAMSRKPILFKDDRGKFHFVQITHYKTHTDATYANAVQVQISLKEFNPYRVKSNAVITAVALPKPEEVVEEAIAE